MTERSNRRLAAILAADVANYSGLVRADEEAVVHALRDVQTTVIDPLIKLHSGRIANTAGDSLLVEFSSAVEAARCGLAMQKGVREYFAQHPDAQQLSFRIGVNIGDVIAVADDLLGDGVNVAARIEALAKPGEVLVSRAVADFMRSMDDVSVTPMGARKVKNLPDPVDVYQVTEKGASAATRGSWTQRSGIAAVVAVVVVSIAGWTWLTHSGPEIEAASEARMAFPLPDKPSIAVLPFADLTEGHVVFTDGLTDDLITDLSKFSGLFVISGNTSFAYRQADMNIAQFAEALGVQYVADGSVRRNADVLRLNVRLIDATTGQVAWAERYDVDGEEIFDVQPAMVMAIVSALGLETNQSEVNQITEPQTRVLEARAAFQRGWDLYSRFNERDNRASIAHFERAVELDPEYGRAYGALALTHLRPHIFHHWRAGTGDGQQLHIEQFSKYLNLASEHETSLIHVTRAIVHMNLGDWIRTDRPGTGPERGKAEARRAIALRPNDPEAHIVMAWALIASGDPDDGLRFVESAMRLDPAYPSHYVLFQAAGLIAKNQLPDAEAALKAGLDRDSEAVELMPVLASVLAQQGKRAEARAMINQWESRESPADLQTFVEDYFFIVRWVGEDRKFVSQIHDGLRLAALPASVTIASLRSDVAGADPVRQLDAVRALGLFGPGAADAVPDLVALLDSKSSILRRSTVITLGRIGPPAKLAIPTLEAIAPHTLVGQHAKIALDLIRREAD